MKILTTAFMMVAIIAAILGSMAGITPAIGAIAKTCLFIFVILFLISIVMTLMKNDKKTIAP